MRRCARHQLRPGAWTPWGSKETVKHNAVLSTNPATKNIRLDLRPKLFVSKASLQAPSAQVRCQFIPGINWRSTRTFENWPVTVILRRIWFRG